MYQVRMVLLSLCMLVICVWSCTHPFSSHKKMRRAWWSRWLSRDARDPSLARAASSLTSPTTPPHATPHTPPSATPHQSPGEPRIIPHTTRATPAPHGALGSVAPHAPLGTPVQRVAPGVNAHHVDDGWPAPILQMMENRFDADAISPAHWSGAPWASEALRAAERKHVVSTWGTTPAISTLPIMVRGEGVHLYDDTGINDEKSEGGLLKPPPLRDPAPAPPP